MRNRVLLASLLAVLGCGGGTAATDAVRADPSLSAMLTELRASPRSELVAAGHDQIVVPAAVFGTTTDIVAWFSFVAIRDNGGAVRGLYRVSEAADGTTSRFAGHLTCAGTYDFNGLQGNRAKVGGRIDSSDDPTIAVGSFIWWQAIDNHGLGRPDQSTLPGFGDDAANSAFCASSNPPRFGPFDVVRGNILVGPGEVEN
jgi:hypothetical protein